MCLFIFHGLLSLSRRFQVGPCYVIIMKMIITIYYCCLCIAVFLTLLFSLSRGQRLTTHAVYVKRWVNTVCCAILYGGVRWGEVLGSESKAMIFHTFDDLWHFLNGRPSSVVVVCLLPILLYWFMLWEIFCWFFSLVYKLFERSMKQWAEYRVQSVAKELLCRYVPMWYLLIAGSATVGGFS